MSAAVRPARRLLALLEDEPSLESRPRAEVDSDLAMLGVDSAGSIQFARGLAAANAGPATALLDAVIDDESVAAEIAALETADIDDVRGRLPAGAIAAVTAEAQRRAGQHSNVVGIGRRRRSAVWAWTGSLVGMAACALIVVAAWWPPSELMPSPDLLEAFAPVPAPAPELAERRAVPAQSEPQPAELSASSGAAPRSGLGLVTPAAEPELATESERDPEQSLAAVQSSDQDRLGSFRSDGADEMPASQLAEVPQSVPPPIAVAPLEPAGPMAGMLIERGTDAAAIRGDVTASPQELARSGSSAAGEIVLPPLPPPTPARRGMETEEFAGAGSAVEETSPEGSIGALSDSRQESDYGAGPEARALALSDIAAADQLRVSAFLVVDPLVAPLTGQFLFSDRGVVAKEGGLSARLADATHAASGRQILALAGLEGRDEAYDVVIVLRDPSSAASAGEPLTPGLAALFGDRATLLEQIRLPPR